MSVESPKNKVPTPQPASNNADEIFPLKYLFYSMVFVLGFLAFVFLSIKYDG